MKRSMFVIFTAIHIVLYLSTIIFEAVCHLLLAVPKFSFKWTALIPCVITSLANFILLFFAAIKNKLNTRRVNDILFLDLVLRITYMCIVFYDLIFYYGGTPVYETILNIAITFLCLSGVITAKIITKNKSKS